MYPVENDTVQVYGVAVTVRDETGFGWKPSKVVLFRKVGGDDPPMLEVVDSAVYEPSGRQCFFEYKYSIDGIQPRSFSRVVPCLEYYFEHPKTVNMAITMTDSMYIGLYNTEEIYQYGLYHPDWFYDTSYRPFAYEFAVLRCDYSTWLGEWWFGGDNYLFLYGTQVFSSYSSTSSLFHFNDANYYHKGWGLMFPIVKLRCAAPRLSLVERDNTTATVSRRQAEEGRTYQISYAPFGTDPDSGTVVDMPDTFYTVTGLEHGVREAVWVRKSCHYHIGGHDTLVWSEWSSPVVFYPLGIGEVDDGSLQVYARGCQVVVEGLKGDGMVRLYDIMGRQVAMARAANGTTVTLTAPAAGLYLVRPDTQPARRIVLTR